VLWPSTQNFLVQVQLDTTLRNPGANPVTTRITNSKMGDRVMTFKKLIEGLLCADPFDLLIFIQWYVGKGITCKDCLTTRKDLNNTLPNCIQCGLPTAKLIKSIFKETKKDEKN